MPQAEAVVVASVCRHSKRPLYLMHRLCLVHHPCQTSRHHQLDCLPLSLRVETLILAPWHCQVCVLSVVLRLYQIILADVLCRQNSKRSLHVAVTGALLLIGGGGFLLSKIDPQFDDFIGAGALKVQNCSLHSVS